MKQRGRPSILDTALALQLYHAGKTDREIADAVGVERRLVTNWRIRHGWPVNTDGRGSRNRVDYDELRRLYEMGLTSTEIMKQMRVSYGSLRNWLARNGLPPCGSSGQASIALPLETPPKPKGQKMFMTDSEIRLSMSRCEDRKEQVQILADLNVCSRSEMLKYLESIGEDITGLSRRRRAGKIDDDRALRLWKNGASDAILARSLGVTKQAIVDWWQRRGLEASRAKEGVQ